MEKLIQAIVSGVALGSIYALIGLGFVIIYKCSRILNFAQGSMLLIGGFLCWFLLTSLGFSLWLSLLVVAVLGVVLGLGIERFPLRPMTGQSQISIIMVTLGIYIVLNAVVTLVWGGGIRAYPPVFAKEAVNLWGAMISYELMYACVFCLALVFALHLFFRFSKTGLKMRGVSENTWLSQTIGINVNTVIALSWGISCVVSMVSGIFLGSIVGISLTLTEMGLIGIAVALFGGLESIEGAIIAGLVMGELNSLATTYIGYGSGWLVPYIVLILVIIIRPYGLFGLKKIERV